MPKKRTKFKEAQDETQYAISITNAKILELGEHAGILYETLDEMQSLFDEIRNIKHESRVKYKKLKEARMDWKHQSEVIEMKFNKAAAQQAGIGAAGIGVGLAVVSLGPTAAMGVATTFGVASTGTAISALSGAAATNAALAWLGGGALAVGGGGMAAGNVFLAMLGPTGWAIAGVALLGSGIMLIKTKNDKKRLEDLFTLICKRDTRSYHLAFAELCERIKRITAENSRLREAIERIKSFGLDYDVMTESQQYELGAWVNLMESSTQLLINPIIGLLPKYTDADFDQVAYQESNDRDNAKMESIRKAVVTLANLLFRITLDDKDKHLLVKTLKKNGSFLDAAGLKKNQFDISILNAAIACLDYKYTTE